MLDKLLTSFEMDLQETFINFFAYKDDDKKIEETNIKKFYLQYLQMKDFRDAYLCFRIFVPRTDINVKSLNDEEADLCIHADSVFLQNPTSISK